MKDLWLVFYQEAKQKLLYGEADAIRYADEKLKDRIADEIDRTYDDLREG